MASFAVKGGKSGPKSVPTPPQHASFLLGSRPEGVRTPPVPRIKPAAGQRAYGKVDPNVANVGGASFGNTGQTSRS